METIVVAEIFPYLVDQDVEPLLVAGLKRHFGENGVADLGIGEGYDAISFDDMHSTAQRTAQSDGMSREFIGRPEN